MQPTLLPSRQRKPPLAKPPRARRRALALALTSLAVWALVWGSQHSEQLHSLLPSSSGAPGRGGDGTAFASGSIFSSSEDLTRDSNGPSSDSDSDSDSNSASDSDSDSDSEADSACPCHNATDLLGRRWRYTVWRRMQARRGGEVCVRVRVCVRIRVHVRARMRMRACVCGCGCVWFCVHGCVAVCVCVLGGGEQARHHCYCHTLMFSSTRHQ